MSLLGGGSTAIFQLAAAAPAFFLLVYLLMQWDRQKDGSPNKDDGQIGLKLALYLVAIAGLSLGAAGVTQALHYVLSGTKAATNHDLIKYGIADALGGGLVIFAVYYMLLPRTNHLQFTRAYRYAAGYVSVISALLAILSLHSFLTSLFHSWIAASEHLAPVAVYFALFFAAIGRFGALSGWVAPPPRQPRMPRGYPQQGYPGQPQPQGYPQQAHVPQPAAQGAFPQAQGAYPQQAPAAAPAAAQPAPQGAFPPGAAGGSTGGGQQGGGGLPPPTGGFPR